MAKKYQPDYDKILSPIAEMNASIEALLEGAFGSMMGDQREGLKRIYTSSWGLHTLFMDIITSLGIENIARRHYLSDKFDAVLEPIIKTSKNLLDGMDGPLSEEQLVAVEFVHHTGHILQAYVDHLTLYSKVLHRQLPIQKKYFVLDEAVDPLDLPVTSDDVALEYLIPKDLPRVYGDERATRIAIQQLVQNAIENTHRGFIRVVASAHNRHIRIEIEDSGSGIAERHHDHIFTPFFKCDRTKDGIGLGLTIARDLLRQQKGDVKLRYSKNTGTLFVCTIPTE